jgi:hypothetical protein
MRQLCIEVTGSEDFGPCECCGSKSRTVWGFVQRGDVTEAAYFVHWTLGQVERHGANFDLIIGRWGDATDSKDRLAVSMELHGTCNGPMFTVIDSVNRPAAASDLVGKALARDEVIGTPLAKQAFELVDAIWLQDERIAEIVEAV